MPSRPPRWIASLRRIEPRDGVHALRALAWLMAAEIAVRLVPYSTLRRWLDRIPPSRSRRVSLTPSECAVAMRRAARVFPAGRCLARAIAASCLLRRARRSATLTLGVGFDADRRFEAHAWLESEGVTVTGGEASAGYMPLRVPARKDA